MQIHEQPSQPLFEIGEKVIIQPMGRDHPLAGKETTVLDRQWSYARTFLFGRLYTWGYKTDISPPGYLSEAGQLLMPWGWSEHNLRKKPRKLSMDQMHEECVLMEVLDES